MAVAAMSRLASGVKSRLPVQHTRRVSHPEEARQILRYWGRFQLENQRLPTVTIPLCRYVTAMHLYNILFLTICCVAEE